MNGYAPNPVGPAPLKTPRVCKHCGASTLSSDDVARLHGWRWYRGESITGKQIEDVICPVCAGLAEPELPPAWSVGCRTCDWQYEPDTDDDEIRDGRRAVDVAHDHDCEPEVWIVMPGDSKEYRPYDFNRDGTLYRPVSKVGAS